MSQAPEGSRCFIGGHAGGGEGGRPGLHLDNKSKKKKHKKRALAENAFHQERAEMDVFTKAFIYLYVDIIGS